MNDAQIALVVWVGQSTLLLDAALLVAHAVRRRPAAAHAALVSGVLAILLIPALSAWAGWSGIGLLHARPDHGSEMVSQEQVTVGALPIESAAADELKNRRAMNSRASSAQALAPVAAAEQNAGPLGGAPLGVLNDRAEKGGLVASLGRMVFGETGTPTGMSRVLRAWGQPFEGPFGALILLWGVCSAWAIARLLLAALRTRQLRRSSEPCRDRVLLSALAAAQNDLSLVRRRRAVELCRSARVTCPVLFAWGRAAVLVPKRIDSTVDWRAIMSHELAHLKRLDHVTALLIELVALLLPWHPLMHAARRRLASLAECACDDLVIAAGRDRADYAAALVAFVPNRSVARWVLAVVRPGSVVERVERILDRRSTGTGLSRGRVAALLAFGVTMVCVTAVAGARSTVPPSTPPVPPPADASGKATNDVDANDLETRLRALRDAVLTSELRASGSGLRNRNQIWEMARELDATRDPRIIPEMIALIAADETYDTVYGLGYFGLHRTTGVRYSQFHDGAWWARWWLANRARFGEPLASTAIPTHPRRPSAIAHTAFPEDLDTLDGQLRWLEREFRAGRTERLALSAIATEIAEQKDPRAIPLLIATIAADDSYDTVYGVGYFGLTPLTDVEYSPYHDGAWWRRWWERNRARFPEEVASMTIPELPRRGDESARQSMPESFETLEGKHAWLVQTLTAGRELSFGDFAKAVSAHKSPEATALLIAIIEADGTQTTIYEVGHSGLEPLTGVPYDSEHDGAWWRRWWNEVGVKMFDSVKPPPIPDLREAMAAWKKGEPARAQAAIDANFPGLPAFDHRAEDDDAKRYVQFGPRLKAEPPAGGWGVMFILPGGDGGEKFQTFCRTIADQSLPPGWIAVQMVAPVWSDDENRVVWPTTQSNPQGARFTTDAFIDAVLKDLAARMPIDRERVVALGWSSSGPALYSELARADTPLRGWAIAMSVFRPDFFTAAAVKNRRVHILHSPEDRLIAIEPHARAAESRLRELGADVKLDTYPGGHGWTDAPIDRIRDAIAWLTRPAAGP